MIHRDGPVLISGDGIAALCCDLLLRRTGLEVLRTDGTRRKVPAVMLGQTAQKLLIDVTGSANLFENLPIIRKRITAWGNKSSKPLNFPHSAVVVSEEVLLNRMRIGEPRNEAIEGRQPDWTIYTSTPLPEAWVVHQFGSRIANVEAVRLKSESDQEACWVESVEDGWLFLLPDLDHSGWVLSVSGTADSLINRSQLIAGQIVEVTASKGTFPAHPRMTDPLCGPGWLACGTAALAFDPLCGDGLGNAVREAILACAIVLAARSGADTSEVLEHYRGRLSAGFRRHLEVCGDFYRSGNSGAWWDGELNSLNRGLEMLSSKVPIAGKSHFRLNGFELESV